MKIALLVVLILAGGAGIYFSIDQQSKLEATVADNKGLASDIVHESRVFDEVSADREAADQEVAQWQRTRGEKRATLSGETDKHTTLAAKAEEVNTAFAAKEGQIKKIQDELAQFDFKDPQEVIDRDNAAKEKNKELLASLEEVNVVVDAAAKKVGAQEEQLGVLQDRQRDYRAKLANNGSEYRIVAVDPEWGFVVVNAGEDSKINAQSVFLVSRGGKGVAKLKVSSLEKRQTVADVVDGSLAEGNRLEVGDKVILLNPQG